MKFSLLFMLFLSLIASCSQAPKTPSTFSVTLAGLTVPSGGLVVTGKRLEGGGFAKILSSDSLSIELPNGTWNFMVIMWDGGFHFNGKVHCDYKKNIALAGQSTALSFSVTNAKCSDTNLIVANTWDSGATPNPNFKPVAMNLCRKSAAQALTDATPCTFVGNSLDSGLAPIAGIKVAIHGGALVGTNFVADNTKLIDTSCREVNNLTGIPRLPAINNDFFMPLVVEGYYKPSCQGVMLPAGQQMSQLGVAAPSTTNNFYASFTDERICAAADTNGLNLLNDIGRGTTGYPWAICRLEQLYDWQRNISITSGYNGAEVYLLRDQNLLSGVKVLNSTVTPNAFELCTGDGSTFVPIGLKLATCPTLETATYSAATVYSGVFNGLGRTISHWRFRPTVTLNQVGFFTALTGQIHHLNFSGVEVEGNNNVGGLVGQISSPGTISNIKFNDVRIDADGAYAGGVVGRGQSRTLTQVHVNNGYIRGTTNIGGIIGDGGTLTDVSFRGVVSSNDFSSSLCGGIAGETDGPITRAATSGLVQCNNIVGGIVGFVTASVSMSYSRSTMSVIANTMNTSVNVGGLSGSHTGGLISQSWFGGSIRHSCTSSCTGVGEIRGGGSATGSETWSPGNSLIGTGLNGASTAGTANMYGANAHGLAESTLCNTSTCDDNAATKWTFYTAGQGGLPRLDFEVSECENAGNLTSLGVQQAAGRGTILNPFILCNSTQLTDLDGRTGHARLEEDIFVPAAAIDAATIDLGLNLNGNGHYLFGARYVATGFAMFNSILSSGTVRNTELFDFYIGNIANTQSATLTYANAGTITNVSVRGSKVIADSEAALVAVTNTGTMSYINASGTVYGDQGDLGAIVFTNDGTIQDSVADADIMIDPAASGSIAKSIGGIAAVNDGFITRTAFEGKISAQGNNNVSFSNGVGGIAGYNSSYITNSFVADYARIRVSEEAAVAAGGLVGVMGSGSNLTKSINMGIVHNDIGSVAGDQKSLVADNTASGTLTGLFAQYPSLYFVTSGLLASATTLVSTNCVGPANSINDVTNGSYFFKTDQNDEFNSATESGTGAISYVQGDYACTSASIQYTLYGIVTETFTQPTVATMNTAGYSVVDMSTNGGATSVKNAYVSFLTTGSLSTPSTWIWEDGKPGLFQFMKD